MLSRHKEHFLSLNCLLDLVLDSHYHLIEQTVLGCVAKLSDRACDYSGEDIFCALKVVHWLRSKNFLHQFVREQYLNDVVKGALDFSSLHVLLEHAFLEYVDKFTAEVEYDKWQH